MLDFFTGDIVYLQSIRKHHALSYIIGRQNLKVQKALFGNQRTMYRLLYIAACLLFLTSCAEQYNIAGNSSGDLLDGRMIYLRVSQDGNSTCCLDSSEVVHGRFNFIGDIDSVMMAHLYMGEEVVMPIVMERAKLTVHIDDMERHVSGGPLNDCLYDFFRQKLSIENEMWEAEQKCIELMRRGKWNEKHRRQFAKQAEILNKKVEDLETKFIIDNYDNALGPGFFMLLCNQFPSPVITDQIARIIQSAPREFMRNPFVRNYLKRARDSRTHRNRDKREDE